METGVLWQLLATAFSGYANGAELGSTFDGDVGRDNTRLGNVPALRIVRASSMRQIDKVLAPFSRAAGLRNGRFHGRQLTPPA